MCLDFVLILDEIEAIEGILSKSKNLWKGLFSIIIDCRLLYLFLASACQELQ